MKVNINKVNELLGHMNEYVTRATAKALRWEIERGKIKPCKACSIGKVKENNTSKNSNHETAKVNDE